MEVNIVLAYDSVDEVCRLFSEYTDMLINGDPEFREYLEIQNYDEELNHLDTKYGLPGGRLYLAYCDGRAAGCVPGQGIAGKLLDHVCRDMLEKGIDTLYLITDHTSFYERYGWEFLCLVEEEEGGLCRMYVHRENGRK